MPLSGEYEPSPSEWVRMQVETYEKTDGAEGGDLAGIPVVIVTTVGRKSGKLRKTPLMRVEHDGRYAVVASKGGAPDEPAWGNNMRKHPHVELQDGADKRDYIARELEGDERTEWWGYATDVWPDYDAYQAKTDRQIAIFVLEPIEG